MQLKFKRVAVVSVLVLFSLACSIVEAQLEAVGAVLSVVPVTSILATAGLVGVKLAAISRLLQALGYDQAYLASGGSGSPNEPIGLQANYAYMLPYVPGLNISVKTEHGPAGSGRLKEMSQNQQPQQQQQQQQLKLAPASPADLQRKTYAAMPIPGDYESQDRPFRGSETLREIFRSVGLKLHIPSQEELKKHGIPQQGNRPNQHNQHHQQQHRPPPPAPPPPPPRPAPALQIHESSLHQPQTNSNLNNPNPATQPNNNPPNNPNHHQSQPQPSSSNYQKVDQQPPQQQQQPNSAIQFHHPQVHALQLQIQKAQQQQVNIERPSGGSNAPAVPAASPPDREPPSSSSFVPPELPIRAHVNHRTGGNDRPAQQPTGQTPSQQQQQQPDSQFQPAPTGAFLVPPPPPPPISQTPSSFQSIPQQSHFAEQIAAESRREQQQQQPAQQQQQPPSPPLLSGPLSRWSDPDWRARLVPGVNQQVVTGPVQHANQGLLSGPLSRIPDQAAEPAAPAASVELSSGVPNSLRPPPPPSHSNSIFTGRTSGSIVLGQFAPERNSINSNITPNDFTASPIEQPTTNANFYPPADGILPPFFTEMDHRRRRRKRRNTDEQQQQQQPDSQVSSWGTKIIAAQPFPKSKNFGMPAQNIHPFRKRRSLAAAAAAAGSMQPSSRHRT